MNWIQQGQLKICESHGRLRCSDCEYIEELEEKVSNAEKITAWIEKNFEEEWTYETGTGEVVEEILVKLKQALDYYTEEERTCLRLANNDSLNQRRGVGE